MDYLRQGIHLRGYAQKNPKQEYKREAFELFSDMLARIKQEVISLLARMQLQQPEAAQAFEPVSRPRSDMQFLHPSASAGAEPQLEENGEVAVAARPQTQTRKQPKVGRNEPCPCGSGKKYKHCHGKLQ